METEVLGWACGAVKDWVVSLLARELTARSVESKEKSAPYPSTRSARLAAAYRGFQYRRSAVRLKAHRQLHPCRSPSIRRVLSTCEASWTRLASLRFLGKKGSFEGVEGRFVE